MTHTIDTTTPAHEKVESTVIAAIAHALDLPSEEIRLDASLQEEYGAESLDILEIVFSLEKAFRIRLPKTNLMQHAQERFGAETFVHQGELTELALRVLREMRPEIDPALFRPGLRVHEVARLVTAQTFVRLALRVLEGKKQALQALQANGCATCGSAEIRDSDLAPEFVCASCNAIYPIPSGDDILMQDLEALQLDHA